MKQLCFSFLALLLTSPVLAHVENGSMVNSQNILESGVGLGAVIAVVTFWSRNRSILWAIFHGICGWLYVVYFALTRAENEQTLCGISVNGNAVTHSLEKSLM